MATTDDLMRYREYLTPVAAALFSTAKAESPTDDWVAIVLDLNYSQSGECYFRRVHLELPDGDTASLADSDDLACALSALEHAREGFPDKWFGLWVRVTSGGECEVCFNDDEHCCREPNWFA